MVTTPGGRITAGKLILTVNGHLASFGMYEQELMHVFTYASMTRQLTENEVEDLGGQKEWGLLPAHPMGSTIRRIKEDRIVVRNTFTYNANMKTSTNEVARIGKRHVRSFKNRFPMLPDVSMQYRWGGHLALTLNSVSVFGEVEKNLYVACCQNGLGVAKGTLNGMLIADLATGKDNALLRENLAQPSPRKHPPEPLMSLGAKLRLWWRQRNAGREY